MPRPKKQVMMERPEELLRSYYEMCTCRGDQYGSPGACDICKTQPEALAQLKKMRKSLVLLEAYQPQPTGGPTSWKEDGKLSAEEFEETCHALYTAITYIQKNGTKEQQEELRETYRKILVSQMTKEQEGAISSAGAVETYTNTPGATCVSSSVVRVGPAEVAFPKEGTELHETLKKKGLFDMLCDDLKATVRKAKGLYKPIVFPGKPTSPEDKALPEDWE